MPKIILDQIGYGAFNFHPGPPSYPGWAPAHFALYDQAAEFGATFGVAPTIRLHGIELRAAAPAS